jgi:hypothetical protein
VENEIFSISLDVATEMELDVWKTWKEQKRIFWLLLNLDLCMIHVGELSGKDDPQRYVWFGRAAAIGLSSFFLNETSDQIRNFNSGTRYTKVVFVIGRALKGHVDNEKRTIFRSDNGADARVGPANQALHFYEFQLQSYRKAVDSWTIVGLGNKVVKDMRKMIGKMIWDAREEAAYLEEK